MNAVLEGELVGEKETDEIVRANAAKALGIFRWVGARGALEKALKNDSIHIRVAAREALNRLVASEARVIMITINGQGVDDVPNEVIAGQPTNFRQLFNHLASRLGFANGKEIENEKKVEVTITRTVQATVSGSPEVKTYEFSKSTQRDDVLGPSAGVKEDDVITIASRSEARDLVLPTRSVQVTELPAMSEARRTTSPEILKLRGTGHSWTLGIDASTQSMTFEMISTDPESEGIIWRHQELYEGKKYKKYGAPEGHIDAIQKKDEDRYLTDPLMVAKAFETNMAELKKWGVQNGLDMSNIKAISPGAQQHATVYLTKAAKKAFSKGSSRKVFQQMKDGNYLAWEHSPIWRDGSTEKQAARLTAHPRFGDRAALVRRTGSGAELRFPAVQADKFREDHPEKWKNTYKILNMTAFIGYLLSGKAEFPWDPGDATPSNLVDVETGEWLPNLNEIIPGIEAKLPDQ